MELSPNDIRSFEFGNQMRGYDKDEVDAFLEQVAGILEAARQENLKLSVEIESLKSQLSGLKQFEDTIKSAAIDARRNADMTVANAKQEAQLMLSKAKNEAETVLVSRTRKMDNLEEQINKLSLTRKSYLSKLRSLIQSHMDIVDGVDGPDSEVSKPEEAIQVTESSEVENKNRETVATKPSQEKAAAPEEANAPSDDPVPDMSDSSKVMLSEALRGVLKEDETPDGSAPVDPELAQALENYKKAAAHTLPTDTASMPPATPELSQPGEVIETNALAEDIPAGFVARNGELEEDHSTDKVSVSETNHEDPSRSDDADGDSESDEPASPLEPNQLAEELDEVAAKFDKEMDKAEKS
jgi:cell division initiation protein